MLLALYDQGACSEEEGEGKTELVLVGTSGHQFAPVGTSGHQCIFIHS